MIQLIIPNPVFVIDDYLDEYELDKVWKEVSFLCSLEDKMLSSRIIGALPGASKNRKGIFLQNIFTNQNCYNYGKYGKKFFNLKQYKDFSESCILYRALKENSDLIIENTLFTIYENYSKYIPHFDMSVFTQLFWLSEDDSKVMGGDLVFKDIDYTINFKSNRMIIFPSFLIHEVPEVKYVSNDVRRYCYTTFYVHNNYIIPEEQNIKKDNFNLKSLNLLKYE